MHPTVRALALTGADQALRSSPGRYFGCSILNTHASDACTVKIYDGTSAAGTLLDTFSLAAGEETPNRWYGPQGISFDLGLFVDVGGTGTPEGSIRVATS